MTPHEYYMSFLIFVSIRLMENSFMNLGDLFNYIFRVVSLSLSPSAKYSAIYATSELCGVSHAHDVNDGLLALS